MTQAFCGNIFWGMIALGLGSPVSAAIVLPPLILVCSNLDIALKDSDFYNTYKAKLQDNTKMTLKNFATPGYFANGKFRKKYSGLMRYHLELSCHYSFFNCKKEIRVEKYIFIAKFESKQLEKQFVNEDKYLNENSLLNFSVKYNFETFSYATTFSPNSTIAIDDINQIKTIEPATDQMKKNEMRLLESYIDYLKCLIGKKDLSESNPFKGIADNGVLVPFSSANQFPLLLPKTLLEKIDRILFSEIMHLISRGKAILIPFLNFEFSSIQEKYIFSLHYLLQSEGADSKEFCSFTLATFDKGSVESFKKITFNKGKEKEKYSYEIGAPHLQEFLLQAMYAGNFEAPLPGFGTMKLVKEDLYIPNPKPFDGLFNLWMKQPTTITYESTLYDNKRVKGINLCGTTLQVEYGKGYLANMRELQSQDELTEELQKQLKSYNESYHLCKGIYALAEKLNHEDCKYKLGTFELIAPEDTESLILNIYAKNNF